MNKLTFNGPWNEVLGKLKQKYGQLTVNDLVYTEGHTWSPSKRLGKAQDKAIKIIAEI